MSLQRDEETKWSDSEVISKSRVEMLANPVKEYLRQFDHHLTDADKKVLGDLAERMSFGWTYEDSVKAATSYGQNITEVLYKAGRATNKSLQDVVLELKSCQVRRQTGVGHDH